MQYRFFSLAFIVSGLLAGCYQAPPSSPMCRVDTPSAENISAPAGCVIRMGDRLLTIRHKGSGKLDIPGGNPKSGESPKCTAHRETWEETGFNVEVQQYLGTNENGFHYYACEVAGGFDSQRTEYPVPYWSEDEVTGIQLVDPFVIGDKDWRFENRLVPLRERFNKTQDSAVSTAGDSG